VNVAARCGLCGESFGLAEVVQPGAGACPRCGEMLAPGYTAVLASTIGQLVTAGEALESATRALHDIAPALHVDRRALYAAVDAADR